MAIVTITPLAVGSSGVAESATALDATDSYIVRNTRRVVLHFKNTGGSASTVTIVSAATLSGFAVADPTVNVPATTGDVFVALGALISVFNDASGDVSFSQDQAAGVTCAALELD